MIGNRGSTIVELLVATGIVMMVMASVVPLLHDGLARGPVLEEAADLHQRARMAVDTIASELRTAGHGGGQGPMAEWLAAAVPRGPFASPTSASDEVLTVTYAPAGAASGTLAQPLLPGDAMAAIESAGCPDGTVACGFTTGMTALVYDAIGAADLLSVQAIGPGVLTVASAGGGRTAAYAAGSRLVEAVQVGLSFDRTARQLRRSENGTSFPLVENVSLLRFELFDASLAPLPLDTLADGPFRGGGALMFDTDLLRVRTVRVHLRLETGYDTLRGADPRFFARPGTARSTRTLPDLAVSVDVTLRNGR